MNPCLIDVEALAAIHGDPDLRVVDCRFELSDTGSGERAYVHSHIPGAIYAHLDRDLSDHSLTGLGRHPMPAAETFASTCARLGLSRSHQVVIVDASGGVYASRLWFMLRALGFGRVKVLDGGWKAWLDAGQPTHSGVESAEPAAAIEAPVWASGCMVETSELEASVGRTMMLVDARAAERFRGEVEPLDSVAGHVPGAVNRPFGSNLDAAGRFRPAIELRAGFDALLRGQPADHVAHMCGSGVTACHNLLAMEIAGLAGSRLYAPSWSGWIADSARPIARG